MKFFRRLLGIGPSLAAKGKDAISPVSRSLTPVSRSFGFDRGQPIDRFYIETFLASQSGSVFGRVLEVGDSSYTRMFGGNRVTCADVLHASACSREATFVGDLAKGDAIPQEAFNCIICTQTFPCIYEVAAAVQTTCVALIPGGVLLATLPGIAQISRYDMDRWGDYWRFTDASARRLFGDVFGNANVEVGTYGNVLSSCAFLNGMAAEELTQEELDYRDSDYQVLITVKAVKRNGG
jgi:hypothetical protein